MTIAHVDNLTSHVVTINGHRLTLTADDLTAVDDALAAGLKCSWNSPARLLQLEVQLAILAGADR